MALQWVVSSGSTRELALNNAWFFFELIVSTVTYQADYVESDLVDMTLYSVDSVKDWGYRK